MAKTTLAAALVFLSTASSACTGGEPTPAPPRQPDDNEEPDLDEDPSPSSSEDDDTDGGASPDDDDPPPPASLTTYTGQVRPILARTCVPCHSEGQIAPFSLDTYERAEGFASLIARVARDRTMPPSVVDNTGDCNTFRDLPWLSEDEIATLERWAEDGAPEGDTAVPAPAVHELPRLTGDVRSVTTPAYVPSTELPDDWRCFVLDSPFDQQTFVTGFDTHPGDKETAHHMVVFYPMDDASALIAQALDELEEGPGYTCFGSPSTPATILAAWAPGGGATQYPDNLGIAVEPGRPLIIQMHYNTAGLTQPGEDRTRIDLQVQTEGISAAAFAQVLDLEMSLPPGKTDAEEVVVHSVADKMPEKQGPVEIYGVFPHMHELGRTLRLTVPGNGGQESCLVDAPRYDFHWQRMYFFDEPVTIDAADQLSLRCVFDTSSRTEVTNWGESTQDEMCVAGLLIKL